VQSAHASRVHPAYMGLKSADPLDEYLASKCSFRAFSCATIRNQSNRKFLSISLVELHFRG
jgi:hypothetical protein